MAFVKHNFKDGDVLSASALNAIENQIALNETNIASVSNNSGSSSDEKDWNFTADYQTEINNVVKAIETIQNNDKLHTVEFITFSDMHRGSTTDHPEYDRMMNAINYLTHKLNIAFVANLGDNYTGYPTEGSTYGKGVGIYEKLVDDLSELNSPYININGNHDSVPHVYKRNWITNVPNAVFDSVGSWFYVDDHFHGVRFIVLDTQDYDGDANKWTTVSNTGGYADRSYEQLNWLANVALKTKNKIIFLQHQSMESTHSGTVHPTKPTSDNRYYIPKDIIDSFEQGTAGSKAYDSNRTLNWDFTSQGTGTVLCNFCGHTHGDIFMSSNGTSVPSGFSSTINEITVDDALYATATHAGTGNTKTQNTVNEIAFDVVSVDLLNKVIKCHRFGTGNNRACTLGGSMTTFNYT